MSVRVMARAWEVDLPDSEKLVLLALADCANDEGFCWPSMATLSKKCSKSDRTVQAAIKALVSKGHVKRTETPGKGCTYTVDPRNDRTPEAASPPKGTTQTPEAASDKPSRTVKVKKDKPSSPPGEKPHRMPELWMPTKAYPADVAELVAQWPPGREGRELSGFRDYWLSRTRDAARPGWDRTWWNRIRDQHDRIMREARHGQRPANDRTTQPEPFVRAGIAGAARDRTGQGPEPSGVARLWS